MAGTTHSLSLSTAYYKADVPVWLDLVSDSAEWADSFLSDEAREVLDVLGGVVVVFSLPRPGGGAGEAEEKEEEARELIRCVGRVVREGLGGWEWDGVRLVVGVGDVDLGAEGAEVLDRWEDVCSEWGLEFVHLSTKEGPGDRGGRNEFGGRLFGTLWLVESRFILARSC